MENAQNFKLLDGVFNPEKAREVLFNLVNSKIRFHQSEIISIEERFGSDTTHSRKRVEELLQVHQEIRELTEQAEARGLHLQVNSMIEVSLVAAEELEEVE